MDHCPVVRLIVFPAQGPRQERVREGQVVRADNVALTRTLLEVLRLYGIYQNPVRRGKTVSRELALR